MPRLPLALARPFLQQARNLPKPGKTSRAARKRLSISDAPETRGLILRSQQGARHFNIKKDAARRSRLKRDAYISGADRPRVLRLLGK